MTMDKEEYIQEFEERFTERLFEVAAERTGTTRLEIWRRYQTDAKFHAQVYLLVKLASSVLKTMDVQEPKPDRMEELNKTFMTEAGDLLGWADEPPEKA